MLGWSVSKAGQQRELLGHMTSKLGESLHTGGGGGGGKKNNLFEALAQSQWRPSVESRYDAAGRGPLTKEQDLKPPSLLALSIYGFWAVLFSTICLLSLHSCSGH